MTYHCAQLEGEQTRRTLINDPKRRRSRKEKITRYHCGGWLKVTIIDDNDRLVRIRITHAETHPPFPEGAGRRVLETEEPIDPRESVMMEVHDLGPTSVQLAPSPSATSPSGDDDFVPPTEYWPQPQDDHHIHLPPEPEMEPYQEPRVSYSVCRCTMCLLISSAACLLLARTIGHSAQELQHDSRNGCERCTCGTGRRISVCLQKRQSSGR